ncbi:MAG TPA: T9SS type A sorting domain-containing protein, partial [Bacteroidia bacterium]|nr:T9SS type A sorting domain-containing protein [Bacteroidia bacterium]
YVNNTLILSAWPFRSTTATSVDHVYMHSLNAASVDYDDIIIGASPVTVTTSQTNITCYAGSNGSASVTAGGGNGVYSYSWSSGDVTATASGLSAGTYTCTVTDGLGCFTTASVSITEPAMISGTTNVTDITCNGNGDGAIDLTPGGGTPGYTFQWSNGATTEDVSGLQQGSYNVYITDMNGCLDSLTGILVQEPAVLSANATSTGITCPGGTDGSGTVAPSGGTGAYTYLWTPGNATTAGITNLTAGSYTCVVTDANGCSASASINLTAPPAFVTSIIASDVLCNGGSTGTADISVSGGTPGYSYSWSNGDMTSTASGLSAGSYTCTVTDNLGCVTTRSVTITEPSPLSAVVMDTNATCSNSCNGETNIVPSGGVAPYSFSWSPGGQTTQSLQNLCPGTYTCNWMDANGCAMTSVATISAPPAIVLGAVTTNPTSCVVNNGSINLTASGGTPSYSYAWSNSVTTEDINGLSAGNYSVVVTDASGCSDSIAMTLSPPPSPTVTMSVSQDTICANDASLALTGATPAGGTWSGPGVTGSTFNPGSAGNGLAFIMYTYTDPVSGCAGTSSDSIFVSACTGVQENTAAGNLQVYPNPNNGSFTIEYGDFRNVTALVLNNSLGEAVGEWKMNSAKLAIDMQSLPAGIYFLQMTTPEGIVTTRIAKN